MEFKRRNVKTYKKQLEKKAKESTQLYFLKDGDTKMRIFPLPGGEGIYPFTDVKSYFKFPTGKQNILSLYHTTHGRVYNWQPPIEEEVSLNDDPIAEVIYRWNKDNEKEFNPGYAGFVCAYVRDVEGEGDAVKIVKLPWNCRSNLVDQIHTYTKNATNPIDITCPYEGIDVIMTKSGKGQKNTKYSCAVSAFPEDRGPIANSDKKIENILKEAPDIREVIKNPLEKGNEHLLQFLKNIATELNAYFQKKSGKEEKKSFKNELNKPNDFGENETERKNGLEIGEEKGKPKCYGNYQKQDKEICSACPYEIPCEENELPF